VTVYDHAFTIAFTVQTEARCEGDDWPTVAEMKAGLLRRVGEILEDPQETHEALYGELPYDTFETDDPPMLPPIDQEPYREGAWFLVKMPPYDHRTADENEKDPGRWDPRHLGFYADRGDILVAGYAPTRE
jgi:hypothetical protein